MKSLIWVVNVVVKMSAYDSVVSGILKLKGKALDVKGCGIKKKKKRDKRYHNFSQTSSGEVIVLSLLLSIASVSTFLTVALCMQHALNICDLFDHVLILCLLHKVLN